MPNVAITSFNNGEVSPHIDGRADVAKYASSCRVLENMLPLVYGDVVRRPGTKYVATAKSNATAIRLIPFIYSATVAYQCEFGNQYIRFFYNGASVASEIESPYLVADLPALQYRQLGDTMWLVHPSYAPRKLTRTSATSFALKVIQFENGPFLTRNDLDSVHGLKDATMTCSVRAKGQTGTLTCSTPIFTADHIGALFQLTHTRQNNQIKLPSNLKRSPVLSNVKGTFTFNTHGTWTGTIKLNRSTDGIYWEAYRTYTGAKDMNVSLASTESEDDISYRIDVDPGRTGTLTAEMTVDLATQSGIVRVDSISSSYVANVTVMSSLATSEITTGYNVIFTVTDAVVPPSVGETYTTPKKPGGALLLTFTILACDLAAGIGTITATTDSLTPPKTTGSLAKTSTGAGTTPITYTGILATKITSATERWAEGAWSAERGYPSALTFFENRIIFGATDNDPQTIWFSAVDDFEDFAADVKDADSFSLVLMTSNRIRWLEGLEMLAVGTSGGPWRVGSTKLEQPLTPTNFSAKEQGTDGSAPIQAVKVNQSVLFLDTARRKVREFTYSADAQQYVAPDMSQLAEHVTASGVVAMAHQKSPDSILWCVTADGLLISMTYERDQNVVAWARHPMTAATVESVSVIPGTTEDEVYIATVRSGIRYIERMAPRAFATQADGYFVDNGVQWAGSSTIITGLTHLEGQAVSILADGAVFADQIVSGGQVVIDSTVEKASVGLPYRYTLEPMRVEVPTPLGSSHGSKIKIAELVVSFLNTFDAEYGTSTSDLHGLDWRTTEDYDAPPAMFTGDKVLVFDGGFDSETPIVISGAEPTPCTVRAIIARATVTGR